MVSQTSSFGSATPVRNPDTTSRPGMTKRAWWLVVLNFLLPGSAQVLAGNRRLGRFAIGATLVFWALLIVLIATFFLAQSVILDVFTSQLGLLVAQVALVFYAVLWAVLTFDTLRLVQLVKAGPAARALVALFSVALLVLSAGAAGRGAVLAGVTRSTLGTIFSSNKQYADPVNGRYNILLLGGDAGPDRVGLRPDSISVASIDAATGKTTLIGVPRNMQKAPFVAGSPMYGPYPHGYVCGDNCLISYLYTYGQAHPSLYPNATKQGSQPGIEATRDAVEGVLGIKIPYYALIDMKGFSDLVDALGGVTITVTEKLPIGGGIDSNGQPIGTHKWIYPGTHHMNGFTAQWYARSRHGTSDYDRMARQRQVQTALLTQFQPSIILTKFEAIAAAGKQVVSTDIPQVMLSRFVELGEKARKQKTAQLELVPPLVYEPAPNFVQIRQLVAKALVIHTNSPAPK
jgi:LCP family protein required for cell wall assembly